VAGAGIAAPASPVLDDAATAAMRWHHRTVDHDLWDHDRGAQPTLMDLEIDGRMRRVLLQGTKTGTVYMLDAATGVALRAAEHRAAPAGRQRLDLAVTAQAGPPYSVTRSAGLPMIDLPCMAPPSAHLAAAGGRARQQTGLGGSVVVFALPR
jgi:glucose dehydrogenase